MNTRNSLAALSLSLLAAMSLGAPAAHAHGFRCGDMNVEHPYARATVPGARTGAVYFKAMRNAGKEADQLVGARTTVTPNVELHQMALADNVMKMRAVPAVEVPGGSEVNFRHGQSSAYHLMLLGLDKPLKEGERFPVTLEFRRSGTCAVEVWVEAGGHQEHKQEHKH